MRVFPLFAFVVGDWATNLHCSYQIKQQERNVSVATKTDGQEREEMKSSDTNYGLWMLVTR